jgi:2,5-diketo-D-gluconate reductase A
MRTQTLNDGRKIPALGLGVFQVEPDQTQRVVEDALEAGYRHVDTAAAYVNEAGVGAAVRASSVPRSDIWVTTKLRNGDHGRESAKRALHDSLERLGLDYVDLFLIHWPYPSAGKYVESWESLQELRAEGLTKSTGVSNFMVEHYNAIRDVGVPAVNQIELHPGYLQRDVTQLMAAEGVVVEAYSPLGQGEALTHEVVVQVAHEAGVTPAQAVLAWHLAHGRVVIPKTTNPARLAENLAAAQIRLSDDAVKRIDDLDEGRRIGGDPHTFSLSQIR